MIFEVSENSPRQQFRADDIGSVLTAIDLSAREMCLFTCGVERPDSIFLERIDGKSLSSSLIRAVKSKGLLTRIGCIKPSIINPNDGRPSINWLVFVLFNSSVDHLAFPMSASMTIIWR